VLDEILKQCGLRFEDLNSVERETLNVMVSAIEQNSLTIEKIRESIQTMRAAVSKELSEEPEYVQLLFFKIRNDKNIYLKARLRNYLLLEGLLTNPEKAKKQLEQAIAGFATRVDK
jgi:hypothetical protein